MHKTGAHLLGVLGIYTKKFLGAREPILSSIYTPDTVIWKFFRPKTAPFYDSVVVPVTPWRQETWGER